MNFKEWLLISEGKTTAAKVGLYADIDDLLGQYPPLYGMPSAADFITYIDIKYGPNGPPNANGFVTQKPQKVVNDRYLPPA